MIETGIPSFFHQHAVLILGSDKKIKDCNDNFLKKFGLSSLPAGTPLGALFDLQGEDIFACRSACRSFTCACRQNGAEEVGWLVGGEDGYYLVFAMPQPKNLLYDSLTEGIAVCTLVLDDGRAVDYIIETVNARCRAMLPGGVAKVQGRRASEVFGGKAPFLDEAQRAVFSGQARQFEHRGSRLRVSVTPMGGHQFVFVLRDIGVRPLQETLNEAAAQMSYALKADEVFNKAAEALRKNNFQCMMLLLDGEARVQKTYFSFGEAPRIYCEKDALILGHSFCKAVKERRAVFLDSLDISPDGLHEMGIDPAMKCIAAPLVVSDTVYGLFILLSPTLEASEMASVTAFVNLMAVMVERCQLVQRLRQHVSRLELAKKQHDEMARRLQIASQASHIGFWEYDYKKDVLYLDDTLRRIYGIADSFSGSFQEWVELLHPDDRINVVAEFYRSIRTGGDYVVECRVIGRGVIRYVRVMGMLDKDESGKVVRLVGTAWDITGRKEAERAVRDSERQLRRIFNLLPVGLWLVDREGRVIKSNLVGKQIWGTELLPDVISSGAVKVRRYPSGEEVSPQDWALFRTVKTGETVCGELLQIDALDGQTRVIRSDTAPVRDEDGHIQAGIVINQDITESERAKAALMAEKELLSTTLKSIGEGVVVTDSEGCVMLVNPAFEQLSGYTQDMLKGCSLSKTVSTLRERSRAEVDLIGDTLRTGKTVLRSNGILMVCRDGRLKSIAHSAAPICSATGEIIGSVLVIRDVTNERKKQKRIDYLVYHDALTGVYNRRYWDHIVKKMDVEENLPISIISCDVNGLKLTNDAFGHSAGDMLLMRMASILTKACRPEDIVVRAGGDEFTILMPRADEQEAARVCRQIKQNSAKNGILYIEHSISVGYSTKKTPSESLQSVMSKAEAYMYRNKSLESPYMRGDSINAILATLHKKNKCEQLHCKHVSEIGVQIAKTMGLSEREIRDIEAAGLMHDIGKVAINQEMMKKPDKLTEEEWVDMKRHPEVGFRILAASTDTAHLARSVLTHHEHFDGGGYPNGLKGEEIPLFARILAVADAFEAMTNERPYRPTRTRRQALEEIERCSGGQFDPDIAHALIRTMR